MTPVSETSLDLEQVRLQIRAEAAQKCLQASAALDLSSPPAAGQTFNWLQVRSVLRNAAQLPPLDALPSVDRYHGLKRRLAQLMARAMLFFARFVLERQASWNRYLLGVVMDMGKALHNAEARAAQQEERIRRLEGHVSELLKGGTRKEE